MKNIIVMFKEKDQIYYREISKAGIEHMANSDSEANKLWKKQVALKDYKKLETLLDKDLAVKPSSKNCKCTAKKKPGRKPKKNTSNSSSVRKVSKKNKKNKK